MQTVLQWRGGAAFEATAGSGHVLRMDGPPEHGGVNSGARPMEVFLSGAAACSAFDVVHILRRGRHELRELTVRAEGERAAAEPKVYTRIHLHFAGAGDGLSAEAFERAARLSVEKYCSAIVMLRAAGCEVSHSCTVGE